MQIIGGKHKKRTLVAPKNIRPSTAKLRETIFNICQQIIEGATFLDLFAGSGAIGLEALSRGARHVTFVEKNRLALATLRKNIKALKEESRTTILAKDVFKALELLSQKKQTFEIIYVDPPYGKGLGSEVLDFVATHPLLAEEGQILIEDTTLEEHRLNHLDLKSRRKAGRALISIYENRTTNRHL